MNTKEIDLEKIKQALGVSYPTALEFARRHGRLDPNGSSRGKWVVAADIVLAELDSQIADIERRRELI